MLREGLLELAAIGPEGEVLARVSNKGRAHRLGGHT